MFCGKRHPHLPRASSLKRRCATLLLTALVCSWCVPAIAQPLPASRSVYHADPQHLWNRLHAALFVRVGPDNREYGLDRLEPLLWYGSKSLLEPQTCDRVSALLEEFLKDLPRDRVTDPLARGVLQRDLWLIFNWVDITHGNFSDPPLPAETWQRSQQRLRSLLVAAIDALALTADQIKGLPDNYAAAVASKKFAALDDPDQPEPPYLPADLFEKESSWICLIRAPGTITPEHAREDFANPFTNSAFLVFIRLPAGRTATLQYVRRLREFNEPLRLAADERAAARGNKTMPNPRIPQFPAGTRVALVRRALLVSSAHEILPSPITESVQLRTYRTIPPSAIDGKASWQSYHELRLSRADLLVGADGEPRGRPRGGLRAVLADERDFKTGFRAHGYDVFEFAHDSPKLFGQNERPVIKATCIGCHDGSGVYSFNSYSLDNEADSVGPKLFEATPGAALEAAAEWKATRTDWKS